MSYSRRSFVKLSAAAALAPALSRYVLASPASDVPCQKLANDLLRPQYHLLPAHNWMNDPNGPIYFRGRYHMFHQYNPKAAIWGNMNWAHATSPDMIHWQHEGIAISPSPNGPDRDGVFSGSAVLDNGKPTMIYTAVAPPASEAEATLRDGKHTWRETQCLAVAADDNLRTWKKLPKPVISVPPAGSKVTGFRDPALWRESDKWMLILGSGTHERGGAILLYSSPDLRHWTYLHPLVEASPSGKETKNPVDTGDMWECPDFFPLGNKHVLLISTMGKVRWKVGTYADQRFTPEKEGVVDWGSYYAAKTMLDSKGDRILWGWIPETRPDSELVAAGWAGVMALPRKLSLSPENELQTSVSPAAHVLRGKHTKIDSTLSPTLRLKDLDHLSIQNLAAELQLEVLPKADAFTIRLQSQDGRVFATVGYSVEAGKRQLRINEIKSPLAGDAGSPVRLHMFLDGSVLEAFANDTTSLTARLYQNPSPSLRLSLDGNAEIASLNIWQMNPISNGRLTGSLCASKNK